MAKTKRKRLVYGIGVVDVDYTIHPTINGKVEFCKIYKCWSRMIERCYSKKSHEKHPTYSDCEVCDEWLLFSNFKKWMDQQDWKGKQLDKDLLVKGNKVYSPETCVFVDAKLNSFVTDSGTARGSCPIGVAKRVKGKAVFYVARCNNPFTGKRECLGCFKTPELAYLAWKRRKHELSCEWASTVSNKRLAESLRQRYV